MAFCLHTFAGRPLKQQACKHVCRDGTPSLGRVEHFSPEHVMVGRYFVSLRVVPLWIPSPIAWQRTHEVAHNARSESLDHTSHVMTYSQIMGVCDCGWNMRCQPPNGHAV
eukprot:1921037-Amphidinium_carterae.1